jgi:mannose-6-phosphate isomerase
MGTHASCPSEVEEGGGGRVKLSEFLRGRGEGEGDLPYLFKVLSIRNALSIQSHPTKQRAAYLHKAFPEHYKDANHKPELALAAAPTLAMCGFRPLVQLCVMPFPHSICVTFCSSAPPLHLCNILLLHSICVTLCACTTS